MARIIAKILSWLVSKAAIYLLILGLLLVIFVVTVVPPMVAKYHEKELKRAIASLNESQALAGELAQKVKAISGDIESKTRRLQELEQKRQRMERWLQRVKNLFRRGEVEADKKRIEAQARELRGQVRTLAAERQKLRAEGGETAEELKRRELLRDEKERQLRDIREMREAFDSLMRTEVRNLAVKAGWILAALIVIPFLWKLLAYYLIAPIAQSTRPILLGADRPGAAEMTSTASHPAQRLTLGAGEVLVTKVDYLQGSMGDFRKGTKWLLDWSYPFSSIAAGLYVLTRIGNVGGGSGQVTLSTREDATEELAVIDLPEGRPLVFRPHYLVALVHPVGAPPRIRARWVFWRLHSWVNLQFRYLIIEGSAKLVFSAQRGIQVESVVPGQPGRRVNSRLTVAFSPHLDYSPKRSETFVAYVWGKSALFDDFFQGSGWVIQQQVTGGKRSPAARFWGGILGAIGKVFGI